MSPRLGWPSRNDLEEDEGEEEGEEEEDVEEDAEARAAEDEDEDAPSRVRAGAVEGRAVGITGTPWREDGEGDGGRRR